MDERKQLMEEVLAFCKDFRESEDSESIELDSYLAKSKTSERTGEIFDLTFRSKYTFCLFREALPDGTNDDKLITVKIFDTIVYSDGDNDVEEFVKECVDLLLEVIGQT